MLQTLPQFSADPVVAVVDAAAAAFWTWSRCSYEERCVALKAMVDGLQQRRNEFRSISAIEIGASPAWTDFNIDIAVRILQQAQSIGSALDDQQIECKDSGIRSVIKRAPAGVVLGMAPWNAAIILATRAVAMPLACGNTVVLKSSEHCPQTHELLVQVFNEAGLPDGVLGCVSNAPEVSDQVVKALIEQPAVRRINFTGSTRVGREIATLAAHQLKPCLLALSDKAAVLVLEDADLASAVDAACYGAFFNQGQVCMASERIIVVEAVADEFVSRLVNKVKTLQAADPAINTAALGRMINEQAATRVAALIDNAVQHGATLHTGGEFSGAVMQPAVLDHVSSAMDIYHEEVFGPVACILRVQDADEALSIANDTRYGLTAAIFSTDTHRAQALADRLETGIVQINGPTVFDDPRMPFGGLKDSGYGRFGAAQTVSEFTELRWIAEHPQGATPSLQ